MEKNGENEQKITSVRKRSYSDHSMMKLAYRLNKKKLDQLKENKIIFGKDISEFINIINELSVSLPNFYNYLKKYFSTLQSKFFLMVQQINNVKNINIIFNEHEIVKGENEENEEDVIDEELDLLFYNFESINDFNKFIIRKRKELTNLLDETIIKEINNRYNSYKLEKNKLLIKLQYIIDDITKIKENIDLVIEKSKKIEDLDIQKNNTDELKILQNYFTSFEKEYNAILSEIKSLNNSTLTFIYEELNKYFELSLKINEELKEEINRLIIGNNNSCENEDKFLINKIKQKNKKIQNDIKEYNLLDHDNRINESSPSLLSRLGDAMLIAPEYFLIFNSFDELGEDKPKKFKEEEGYNKEDLSILKKGFIDLKSQDVVSDDSLNKLFGLLGNVSDKKKYLNLCLSFVKYINKNSFTENLRYKNVENFIFTNNIYNIICHNCPIYKVSSDDSSNKEFDENTKYFEIIDNIIKIGNESSIGNKYMCSLFKNNDIMRDIKTFKYSFKSNLICTITKSLKIIKKNINPMQNVIDLFNNKIISSFKKFDFIEEIGLDNYIDSYKELTYNEKINFNNNEFFKIIHNSLKQYIIYMANYNIDYPFILKFIKGLNDYFPFMKENITNFYINYYKSSLNSIKRYLFQSKSGSIKTLKKMNYIKEGSSKDDIFNKNKDKKKKLVLILKNIMPFLDIKQKIDLIRLNKDLNMKKYYYKTIFSLNELSIEKRLKLWQIILCNKNCDNINYKQLLTNLKETEDYKVIMDDTKRTSLINKDKEKTQEIVKNILCCFISNNDFNVKYCQGMNFIVAFLYSLTDDEELSYILFKSLIENTNLKSIYDRKFELLHCYFYILERLISFFLPVLKKKFEDIQMNIDCFSSAYFLTLFSNVFILNNNCKKFMTFIFENFIINGWKVIFKSILAVLKYNEEEIMNKKEEGEIFNFVIQNLKKSDIFLDENYEKFLNIYNYFDVNNSLISSLKEEYNSEKEIKKELNIKSEI